MNLPGLEWAKSNGWGLYCHSGDRKSATYTKKGISLTVDDGGTATLEANIKMVNLKVGPFSFPGNIGIFEKQIYRVYVKGSAE